LSWGGKENKVLDSQNALFNRSKLNSIATLGEYSNELENPSA
jgi:hypothetical protein